MNSKLLIPALMIALLSGCASTPNDPTRDHVLADLAQARADGSFPLTEAQYVYPNWTAASHKVN